MAITNLNMLVEPISYAQAGAYLDEFKKGKHHKDFNNRIGGYFDGSELEKWIGEADFQGLMFWFGLGLGSKKTFMIVEKKSGSFNYPKTDSDIIALKPAGSKNDFFIATNFIEDDLDCHSNMESYLKAKVGKPSKKDRKDDLVKINKIIDRYKSNPKFKKNHLVAHGYMTATETHVNHLNEFFGQGKVSYIRYYFGYDTSPLIGPHKMRFFLVPVDSAGNSFSKQNLYNKAKDPILLQKSWPPYSI